MQFFGGKTGGAEINSVMNSLGLSLEKQKKRFEAQRQRNAYIIINNSGSTNNYNTDQVYSKTTS